MPGTYVLCVDVGRGQRLEVGALGRLEFEVGTYAYVGSALGPGGFSRVERHRELSRGDRETRHWHVDYLLGATDTTLERAVLFPGEDRECELADALPGKPIAGFGASDCDCEAHLLETDPDALLETATALGGVLDPPGEQNDTTK